MTLAEVGLAVGTDAFEGLTTRVAAVTDDSRAVTPGTLFVAISGANHDGADFAGDAVARGAVAVLCDRPLDLPVPVAVVTNPRRACSVAAASLAGRPDDRVRVVGVTGTDGKTTTTWLIRHLLRSAGRPCGLVGTVETDDGRDVRPAEMTTPRADAFWPTLAAMDRHGLRHAAVECSSQALSQDRLAGLRLDAAVVTNVTADHLDWHGTLANYRAAKRRLFEGLRPGGVAVLNADDACFDEFAAAVPGGREVVRFGFGPRADVRAEDVAGEPDAVNFTLALGRDRRPVRLPLIGEHNVANALAAAAFASRVGLTPDEIAAGLETAAAPPGRLERVATEPCDVFVDYAHTTESLTRAIETLRAACFGRLIVVTGAGGERDRTKRPAFGRAVSAADAVVLTADNSRSEDTLEIIAEIAVGVTGLEPLVRPDRREAIAAALDLARPGDRVLVAGRGHERFQKLDGRLVRFDDRAVAAELAHERAVAQPV